MKQLNTKNVKITNRTENTVRLFNDLKKYRPLTAEEELEHFRLYREEGNQESKNILILSNIKLVISAAKNYSNNTFLTFEDHISNGMVGLMRALDKFDTTKGYRFITYAISYINQSILYHISEHNVVIRKPNDKTQLYHNINKERDKIYQEYETDGTLEMVENNLNEDITTNESKLKSLEISDFLNFKSLDSSLSETDETQLIDVVPNPDADFTNVYDDEYNKKFLSVRLKRLTGEERTIIEGLYGLKGQKLNTEVLAEKLGRSVSHVKSVQNRSLEKLRKMSV